MAHRVHLDNMTVGKAVQEKIEDRMAEAIQQAQEPGRLPGKATINLKVTMDFDQSRSKFVLTIADELKGLAQQPYGTILYCGVDKGGEAFLEESDPGQRRLPFDDTVRA